MTAKEVLAYYAELAITFDKELEKKKYVYQIYDNDAYKKAFGNNLPAMQKVYWREILQRAHWAALSGLLRNLKWTKAVNNAIAEHNLLSFTANLRCLIESSGDNLLSLQIVSEALAENNEYISNAIQGKLTENKVFISKELEENLIHFAYGRKISQEEKELQGKLPKYQNAKPASEYLKRLDNKVENGPIGELYGILCQFAHPAAHSIHYMFKMVEEDSLYEFSYLNNPDTKYIDVFLESYKEEILDSLMFGFNPCFVTLKTLNLFDYSLTQTPLVDNIDLNALNAWNKVVQKFANSSK